MLRHETVKEPQSFLVPEKSKDDDFENDSDLDDELAIDESGNVLSKEIHGDGEAFFGNNTAMAHILAGYGTDICEKLISEFVKLEVNTKQLSLLGDKDLEMLGIKDPKTRQQMLAEFAELPNQEHLEHIDASNDPKDDNKQFNDLVLSNVYKHLNCLKTSLSVLLLRMYVEPTENVLINEHTYASEYVLSTLYEFSRSVVAMEKRLLDLQYGNRQIVRPTRSNGARIGIWMSLAAGVFSVGGVLIIRYLNLIRH